MAKVVLYSQLHAHAGTLLRYLTQSMLHAFYHAEAHSKGDEPLARAFEHSHHSAVLSAAINEKAGSDSHLPRFFSVSSVTGAPFPRPVGGLFQLTTESRPASCIYHALTDARCKAIDMLAWRIRANLQRGDLRLLDLSRRCAAG
jgi:hypothetical protein